MYRESGAKINGIYINCVIQIEKDRVAAVLFYLDNSSIYIIFPVAHSSRTYCIQLNPQYFLFRRFYTAKRYWTVPAVWKCACWQDDMRPLVFLPGKWILNKQAFVPDCPGGYRLRIGTTPVKWR